MEHRTWKGEPAAVLYDAWIFDAVNPGLVRIWAALKILKGWTMRFFCPRCWSDFAEDVVRCPKCGLDIPAFFQSKDYVDRLILALDHPEKATPLRAALILGQLKQPKAVEPLIACVQKTRDVYVIQAAIKALGQIGGPEAIQFLKDLCHHPSLIVREEAAKILDNKGILSQKSSEQKHDRPNP